MECDILRHHNPKGCTTRGSTIMLMITCNVCIMLSWEVSALLSTVSIKSRCFQRLFHADMKNQYITKYLIYWFHKNIISCT